jgi:hypothetical protein
MGYDLENWDGIEGPIYIGAGSAEMIWLIIAIVICVVACISGSRHELHAYRKLRDRK